MLDITEGLGENSPTQDKFDYTQRETVPKTGKIPLLDDIIEKLEKLKSEPSATDENKTFLGEQLVKLKSLQYLEINTEEGPQRYYSYADNAGGVTEKTCLISGASLDKKLTEIKNNPNIAGIKSNKIQMNAILKHPKAGKDTEVQREAMGLEMARLLGFPNVTKSTMVRHNTGKGVHPCLFVPFETIDLLTDFLDNTDTMKGRLKVAEMNKIEDLGKYSAYFMLCSDPDFIGKNGQNKALIDNENKSEKKLFIFDQVFMADQNLGLDRAFNLVPTNIARYMPNFIARHFMGRNKSVINDSSYEEKVGGAQDLLSKADSIRTMFSEVIKLKRDPDDPIASALQKDAKICLSSFESRIESIKKLFPKIKIEGKPVDVGALLTDQAIEKPSPRTLVNKAMILNQLLNKPQLCDKYGKAYRAPFFTHLRTQVKEISISGDRVEVRLGRRFGIPISKRKEELLKEMGFTVSPNGKSASIKSIQLGQLNAQEFVNNHQELFTPTNLPNKTSEYRHILERFHPSEGSKKPQPVEEVGKSPPLKL